MSRDYNFTVVVSLTKVYEMKPSKNGARRTYLLIDNSSGAPIKYDFGVAPNDFNGSTLPAGAKYEREQNPPDSTVFVRGTLLTDQIIQVGQGYSGN